MPRIKAIVFDAYGTLFDVQSLTERLVTHFGDQAKAVNAIWRRKQLEYTWLRSLMGRYESFSTVTAEALAYACAQLNLNLEEFVEEELIQCYYTLAAFKEIPASLEKLSSSYRLGILSNADPAMLQTAVKANQLDKYLYAVISADQIRQFKPVQAVYNLAEQTFQTDRTEIAFVSSNTWDVSGAKSYGLYAVWLRRGNTEMDKLGFKPDREIRQINELESFG